MTMQQITVTAERSTKTGCIYYGVFFLGMRLGTVESDDEVTIRRLISGLVEWGQLTPEALNQSPPNHLSGRVGG